MLNTDLIQSAESLGRASETGEVSRTGVVDSKELRRAPFTCGGLFAGIGGFCFGFEAAGFDTLWCNDLSKEAAITYQENFPSTNYIQADIKQLNATNDLSPVDVLHAGFPCQSFSAAGLRLGFADPRGQLFFEIVRLLHEWGPKRPKVLVLENSPHLRDGESGAWFRTIQTEIQRCGYWFASSNAFILDTREHGGLPQRRKRLFMIAVSQDFADFNPIDLGGVKPELEMDIGQVIKLNQLNEEYFLHEDSKYAHMIQKQVINDDPFQLYHLRKYFVRVPEKGVCPTLTANMGLGGHNVPFVRDGVRMRKLTESECLELQGFPLHFRFPNGLAMGKRYQLIGNSVSPVISKVIAMRVGDLLSGKIS